MLSTYDRQTGKLLDGELWRSQEFRTERDPTYVSRGVIELSTRRIYWIYVLREPDREGNFRVADEQFRVNFGTSLGSLKAALRQEGNVTQVMPLYEKKGIPADD